jgi:hypothetical protein
MVVYITRSSTSATYSISEERSMQSLRDAAV